MAKANNKLSRFAKRHYEAIAEAMQEAYGSIDHDGPASDLVRAGINKTPTKAANVKKVLANLEPSTHDPKRTLCSTLGLAQLLMCGSSCKRHSAMSCGFRCGRCCVYRKRHPY